MNMLLPHIQHSLMQLNKKNQLRHRDVIEHRQGHLLTVNGKTGINFCSNDYLGIATDPQIKRVFSQAAQQYGLGSSASAMVSGYSKAHQMLEEQFAAFTHRECALLFNSGYHANLGVITTFAHRHSAIIADKFLHASLIDGIQLSRSRYYRYHHHDLHHAEILLQHNQGLCPLVVTESIFSIQGDIANLKEIAALASQYQAMLIVDDAHAIGILGKNGSGSSNHFQLTADQLPCVVTPLGKAPGSMGALVAGDKVMIEALLQLARPYRYSTALPVAHCYATSAALTMLQTDHWRRDKLQQLIHRFIRAAKEREFTLLSHHPTPIKSILIGSSQLALAAQQHLQQHGLFTACIRPPTVPINAACIRISLNCLHTEEQIDQLLDRLKDYLITANTYE
jgi:8-amino-7-oxononanoate synthase